MKSYLLGLALIILAPFAPAYSAAVLTKRFINARLLIDHGIKKGELWVRGDKIVAPQSKADRVIDAKGSIIAPGYIDLQINGAFGCDFSRNPEKVELVARKLPQYGVVAFLPTLVSLTSEQYKSTLPLLQPQSFENGAAILGIHLEGPFFSAVRFGAHSCKLIHSSLKIPSLEDLYGSLKGVKLITLAPELPGALQWIAALKNLDIIVAAGHSNATFQEMQEAIANGVKFSTHLFNAMRPYHHRDPGLIGAILLQKGISYSLIADEVHLSPQTIDICWRCNPEGLILVTDAIEALGLPDGIYQLGADKVEVKANRANLLGTEVIAGSVLSLDQAVRNLKSATNCSIVQALEAASLKPAQLLNLYPSKGSLHVGSDADFILLSDDLHIQTTYIAGEPVWNS